jgi:Ran-binding protein 3
LYQVRAKLYTLSDANSWKERGSGQFRLNVRREDGSGARLVMRKEAVHSLILNVGLFKGMCFSTAQDPRYIRFSAIEEGKTTHYNLRVSRFGARTLHRGS